MKKHVFPIIALLFVVSASAWSQSSVSGPLAGDAVRASYGDGAQAKNSLTTTISVSTHIDDNALNDNSNKLTDAITNFTPSFAWTLTRQRWTLDTEYTPSFSYSIELPRYNTVSHFLSNSLSLKLAQHVNLRLRNSFARTSDPFGRLSETQLVSGFGVLDRTNPALFGPPTLYTSEQAGLDLTYMPAAHTTVGVSGSYAVNYYDDLVASPIGNRDTHMASGRAFVDQKLSPRQSVSVAYNYQVVTSPSYGRTVSHSVLLFDNWTVNPKFNISVFAGPQYIDSHQIATGFVLPLRSGWSWSAGGTLSWSGAKTGVSVSAVRRVSDGGGIGGAVQMTDFSGNVSQKIGKKWSANFFASYTLNGSNATGTSGNSSLRYFSGGVGVNREIIRNLSFSAKYWYVHQSSDNAVPVNAILADHNRVDIGLSYSFSHPLGR
jgi:hypothetical protein